MNSPAQLTWQSLGAYTWMQTPVWVFDFDRLRVAWANHAALDLWRAASLEELLARDFSDASPSARAQLVAVMKVLECGESVTMNWTIYPRGVAVQVRMRHTGIRLEDSRLAILSEAHSLVGEGVSTAVRRDLEALNHSSAQISIHRTDGAAVMRNPAAVEAFGPPDERAGRDDFGAQVGGQVDEIRRALEQGGVVQRRVRVETRRGVRSHVVSARRARDPVSGSDVVLLDAQDVTDATAAEAALERREQELHAVMDSVPAMICYADTGMRFVYANQRYADWVGCPREQLLGVHIRDVVGEDTFCLMEPYLLQVLAGHEARYERRQRDHAGTARDFEVHYVPNFDAQGAVCGYFVMLSDVTERKKDEELLYFLANHDQLTALPNRNLFNEHLQLAVAQAARAQEKLATLFIDLDRFKNVNDTLGHDTGDVLLRQVASRFRACLRESDLVARLGGDEYTVLLRPTHDTQEVATCAQKLINALARPLEVNGHELYVTCSVGISLYPDDGKDAATLLKHADLAMYRAKEQGKNNYQFYSSEVTAASFEHLMLETSLRRALEREEFVLHHQPIVDLRTQRITGMEALVRWQHPELGMVAPAKFIPLAEETGLIVPIGQWVLEQACRQARALQREAGAQLHLAVNLSARQFRQKDLVRTVGEVLARTGFDARHLELEVTESSVMENADAAVRTLHELKAMGIHVSIDDFGTGYSSLSYLKRFPIDALKVDQSFVRDITSDPDDAAIASAIIAMGHSLRLTIIAEGVETEEQLAFLRERECHKVQGYLFGRPMPAPDLAALLQARRSRAWKGVTDTA